MPTTPGSAKEAQDLKGNYASVNGLNLYYEIHGKGQPLILLHGGFGLVNEFGTLVTELAKSRQVIGVELQGHGHTADIDRPLSYELMADDVAALIKQLGIAPTDILGYSLGGGAGLQTAIRHPELVHKLVFISIPFKRAGWYPEVLAGMAMLSPEAAQQMMGSPMQLAYAAVAPKPENFPKLAGKIGDLLRKDYDWSAGVAGIQAPTLLIYGDADSIFPAHMVEFFGLLGGGKQDAGWMEDQMPKSRLAVLPATSHYRILQAPLAPMITSFLDAPMPQDKQASYRR